MISIYQQPTVKNPTLGMTIQYFPDMSLLHDRQVHENLESALYRVENTKISTLSSNLEYFWQYCDSIIKEKNQAEIEAIKNIRDLSIFILNKNKYKNCLDETIKNANFVRLLCRVTKDNHAIMMAAVIMRFCKDECEEIESKKRSLQAAGG